VRNKGGGGEEEEEVLSDMQMLLCSVFIFPCKSNPQFRLMRLPPEVKRLRHETGLSHLVSGLGVRGEVPPLPSMPSWHDR
jgi:hypothetical protein